MEPPRSSADSTADDLRTIRREAGFSAVMTGLTESFMIPYALALGASAFQAGLLSSCRNLILSLLQLKSADAVKWFRSRKRLVVGAVAVQGIAWLPLVVVDPLFGSWAVAALIALYTLGSASAAFAGPAWGSMVSEYLPPEERGRFFGRLTFVAGIWAAVAALAAGGLLHLTAGAPLFGFGLLCAGAALSRAASCGLLVRMHERPLEHHPHTRFSFWDFLRQTRTSNFARFTLSVGAFSFGVHLAGPYLAVYMLEDLHYDYLIYTAVVQAGGLASFIAARWWGAIGDRLGNRAILRWTMVVAALLPAVWPLSGDPTWLLAVYVAGGCVWGGFNLAVVNFIYDAVTPAKRARCLAYFNVINGCGVSLGALAGGWLLDWLPRVHGSTFASLFYCSAALRVIGVLLFWRTVREVRAVHATGLRHVVYDLVGQRLINVLSLPSGDPAERRRRRRRPPRHGGGSAPDDGPRRLPE